MKQTYKLRELDGKLYVSVRELADDVLDALKNLNAVQNDPRLLDEDNVEFKNTLLGLHAVHTLLTALVTEHEFAEKIKNEPLAGDISIRAVQFDVPIEVKKETLH